MPNGLITPGLVWQVWEAGQDYQVTATEFDEIMGSLSSIVAGAFVFGAMGMMIGAMSKGFSQTVQHHSSPAKNQITTTELQEVINNLRPQFDRFKETIDRSLDEGREIGYIIDNKYRLTGPFIGSAKGVTFDLTKEELEYMRAIGSFHTHIEREKPVPSRLNWLWMGLRGDKILCVGGKAREKHYLYVGLRREELPSGMVKIDETTIPIN